MLFSKVVVVRISGQSLFELNIHECTLRTIITAPNHSINAIFRDIHEEIKFNFSNDSENFEVKATKFYIFENVVYRCRTHKPP